MGVAGKEAREDCRERGGSFPELAFKSAGALLAADPGPQRGAGRPAAAVIHSLFLPVGQVSPCGTGPAAETRAGVAPFFQRRYAPIMNFSGNAIMISVLSRRFSHKCSLVLSGGGGGALFSQSSFKNYVLP